MESLQRTYTGRSTRSASVWVHSHRSRSVVVVGEKAVIKPNPQNINEVHTYWDRITISNP